MPIPFPGPSHRIHLIHPGPSSRRPAAGPRDPGDRSAAAWRLAGMRASTLVSGLVGMVIGGGLGWVLKPAPEGAEALAAEAGGARIERPDRPAPSRATAEASPKIEVRPEDGAGDDEIDPEVRGQMEEAQRQQREVMMRGIRSKFDLRISRIVEELGLDEQQEAELRAYVDGQLEGVDMASMMNMAGPGNAEKITELATVLRGDGIAGHLDPHLSDEQREGLEAMQVRQRETAVESRALKELSKIQGSLDLSDEQKDQVYTVLVDDAGAWLDNQSDGDFVAREMMSSMGMEMDFGDMDMGAFAEMEGPGDRREVMLRMREEVEQRREQKIERMRPILSGIQLERYRRSLESQGGMFNMMIDNEIENEGE